MNKQMIASQFRLRYKQMTQNQKAIAKYIMDHYESAAYMSAHALADAVGVSDATVIRFSQAAGFKGYRDMIGRIRDGVKAYGTPERRISKSLEIMQNQKHLFKQIMHKDMDNLIRFSREFDFERIRGAVDIICKARRIFLLGVGSSSLLVSFLHMQLRRMGFDVLCASENGIFDYEKMLLLQKSDALIACTFPRYAKHTLSAAAYARKKGVKIISITDSDFSPISAGSDIVLRISVDNITFFHSWVVGMELCNLLLMSVLERKGDQIYEKVKENGKNVRYFYRSFHQGD